MLEFYRKAQQSVLTYVIMYYEFKWDYMDIETFHCPKVAKSILWTVIGCRRSVWVYYCIYTPACFSRPSDVTGLVLSYHPFYFLSASWSRWSSKCCCSYSIFTLEQWLLQHRNKQKHLLCERSRPSRSQ